LPDIDQDQRQTRVEGVREQGHAVAGQGVDPMWNQPELIIEKPGKRVGGNDRRNRPGDQVDRPREPPTAEFRIEEERDQQSDEQFERRRAKDEYDGELDGAADAEVGPQVAKVVEADEVVRAVEETVVRETERGGAPDRVGGGRQAQDNDWQGEDDECDVPSLRRTQQSGPARRPHPPPPSPPRERG